MVLKKHDKGQTPQINLWGMSQKSSFAESFRTLRTNINFSFMDKGVGPILVTSAVEREGKSTITANLAYTMARAGKSVLIIDADLRKPVMSRFFSINEKHGLPEVLAGDFSRDIHNGELGEFSMADLFQLIKLQNRTGGLSLTADNEKIDFLFFKGDLVEIKWLNSPENENIDGVYKAFNLKTGLFTFSDISEFEFLTTDQDVNLFKPIYRQIMTGGVSLPYLQKKITKGVVETGINNLYLLPTHTIPPNPSELLSSNHMLFLISQFSKMYDRILIDSPPILPASDALIMAHMVEGVVMVVKSGSLNRKMVQKGVESLKTAKANLLGVVLNQVNVTKEGYYKYYNKYYSHYYGENPA